MRHSREKLYGVLALWKVSTFLGAVRSRTGICIADMTQAPYACATNPAHLQREVSGRAGVPQFGIAAAHTGSNYNESKCDNEGVGGFNLQGFSGFVVWFQNARLALVLVLVLVRVASRRQVCPGYFLFRLGVPRGPCHAPSL